MSNGAVHRRWLLWLFMGPPLFTGLLPPLAGCNSILNAWLDPTVLGNFSRSATMEIRSSLTLEDTPLGIPGTVYPSPADLEIHAEEYPISPGDTLAIEIFELRQRQVPYQLQTAVSSTGFINLPVIGRIKAAGLTLPEFEDRLRETLRTRDILRDPELTVDPVFLQAATYSIFGIGVSASTDAPLRAGTFPIRRPDLRVLEAINLVGGLSEFVTDVYVFRYDTPPWARRRKGAETREPASGGGGGTPSPADREESEATRDRTGSPQATPTEGAAAQQPARSPEDELIEAVVGSDQDVVQPETEKAVPETLERLLEPEPTQPYVWVNNEFVENPAYKARSPGTAAPPPAQETVTPAVNWARIAGDAAYRVIRIPADQLREGNPEVNIVVRAGDVIRIVSGEIGVYYVMGQVNRVGAFAFNTEPITLKAAIAAAGGLSGLAWPDRCTVYRRIGQREQMIQVNLDRVFAGKDPDFYVKRGDIINVGTHPFAPFLRRIRAMTLPTPVNNVGYSFTYARNFADIDSFAVRRNPHNEAKKFPALFP